MTAFVLIHGAYQGGWIWGPVAQRLRAEGHVVHSPSMDGCGERSAQRRPGITTESQAEEIAQLLFYEDLSDVVLVGTSSGGMVAAKTAELARERVARLVFVDALVLMHGETIGDVLSGPRPANVGDGGPSGEHLARLLQGLPAETAAWAGERFGGRPDGVFTQPVELESFWDQSWDVSVIWCRRAENPGEAHQRRCAEALGARWHELDTGHYPMISEPGRADAAHRRGVRTDRRT